MTQPRMLDTPMRKSAITYLPRFSDRSCCMEPCIPGVSNSEAGSSGTLMLAVSRREFRLTAAGPSGKS